MCPLPHTQQVRKSDQSPAEVVVREELKRTIAQSSTNLVASSTTGLTRSLCGVVASVWLDTQNAR